MQGRVDFIPVIPSEVEGSLKTTADSGDGAQDLRDFQFSEEKYRFLLVQSENTLDQRIKA